MDIFFVVMDFIDTSLTDRWIVHSLFIITWEFIDLMYMLHSAMLEPDLTIDGESIHLAIHPSICLSVTCWYWFKTADCKIMQFGVTVS